MPSESVKIKYNLFKYALVLLLFVFFVSGCATVYNPVTERDEYIFIDTATEVNMGKNFAQQVENDLKLSSNPYEIERVASIGKMVAAVSDRLDLEYHFGVIEDEQLNAFALPGGYIYVNTGLLEIVDDNELACVLAHEVAHIAAKHGVKAMQAALGYDLFLGIVFAKSKYQNLRLFGSVLFDLVHMKYSREDETLADRVGIKYAHKAGYNPGGIITFFEKLKAQKDKTGGGEWLLFLRSHPTTEQRIADAKKEIELLK